MIAESNRSARLIESAARPETSGQGLIKEPPVRQQIERRIGGLDMDGTEGAIPEVPDSLQRASRRFLAPKPLNQCADIVDIPTDAQREYDFAFPIVGKIERDLH